jgi:serine/threonine protein kinase
LDDTPGGDEPLLCAVKVITPRTETATWEAMRGRTDIEHKVLTHFSGSGLFVPVIEVRYDELKQTAVLVTEYMSGGTWADRTKKLATEKSPEMWFAEVQSLTEGAVRVANGLQLMHDQNLLHGDIKPGNLFCNGEGSTYVGDCGTVRRITNETDPALNAAGLGAVEPIGRSIFGTVGYVAPELIYGDGCTRGQSDVFALCASLYCVLSKQRAYSDYSKMESMARLRHNGRALIPPPPPMENLNNPLTRSEFEKANPQMHAFCAGLAEIVRKGMAFFERDRQTNAAVLAEELKNLLETVKPH